MTNDRFRQRPEFYERRKSLRNNATETEQLLWFRLKGRNLGGYKFTRQYSIGFYIVDFYCPQNGLVVELDGSGHTDIGQVEYDKERTLFLQNQGCCVVRFWNASVYNDLDSVCEEILFTLEELPNLREA